jgi:hypothetical protein
MTWVLLDLAKAAFGLGPTLAVASSILTLCLRRMTYIGQKDLTP